MTVRIYRSTDAGAPSLSGTAGSAITLLDACLVNGYGSTSPAGWSKAYSGTNLAAYRMSTVGSTGCYIRVDDTGTYDARIVGYKTMSDVNTGTGAFPTSVQFSGGLYLKKSTSADAVVRPWTLIADERFFYLFTNCNQTVYSQSDNQDGGMYFGDLISYLNNDGYECIIIGNNQARLTSATSNITSYFSTSYAPSNMYLARDYTGFAVSRQAVPIVDAPVGIILPDSTIGRGIIGAYPDPVTGKLNLFAIEILENAYYGVRGRLPGFWFPFGGTLVGNNTDTFTGVDNLSGKNFILINLWNGSSSTTQGRAAIQYDGDWR
jgi:hypothetical protein